MLARGSGAVSLRRELGPPEQGAYTEEPSSEPCGATAVVTKGIPSRIVL